MSENKVVQDKPKTEQEKAQEFIKAYSELCEKHKFQIVVTPAFKARDDGTFSVVLQSSVGKLPIKS
jgi:fatty acid-binding protein DegV